MKTGRVAAVIPAGGTGRRMEAAIPKQFLMLGDVPLLLHSLQVFERAACISQVILVVPKDERERTLSEIIERYGIKKVVTLVSDFGPGLDAEKTFQTVFKAGDGEIVISEPTRQRLGPDRP